ncbi:MAG: lysophospholipid acyltransferase family protein [Gammaproteobacteria bacterium]|nr:lysophospholipid acyltransferase family protein [Gammaproteobacteria bacterium]
MGTVLKLISRLPLPVLYMLAWLVYALSYHVFRFRKRLTCSNLRDAFPQMGQREVRVIAKRCYRQFADVLVETVKSMTIQESEIRRRVRIANPEVLEGLRGAVAGQAVLFLAAHQCNWEWLLLASRLVCPFPVDAVYKPARNPMIDRLLVERRARFGGSLIPVDRFIAEVMRRHDGPRGLALVADQTPRVEEDKYWTRFMGLDTAFYVGPQKIAAMKKAPVYFVAMRRLQRGYYEVSFERLAVPPYSMEDHDVVEVYVRAVERQVRAAPHDWLWMYKKWKYRKPLYA